MKIEEAIIPTHLDFSTEIPAEEFAKQIAISTILIDRRGPKGRRGILPTATIVVANILAACNSGGVGSSPIPSRNLETSSPSFSSSTGEMDITGGGLEKATPEKILQRLSDLIPNGKYYNLRIDVEDMSENEKGTAQGNCVDYFWMVLDAYGVDHNLFRPSNTAAIIGNNAKKTRP